MNLCRQLRAGLHMADGITLAGVRHDRRCLRAADRIDELEAALREIASRQYGVPENAWKSEINALSKIAKRALKERSDA